MGVFDSIARALGGGQAVQSPQRPRLYRGQSWIRQIEPFVIRSVALLFSFGSAVAVHWFLAPLDLSDAGHFPLSWSLAIGFGVLGFVLSRGLAHRMMTKESIWVYAPLFSLALFFEVLCNYSRAAFVAGDATWLARVPHGQQAVLTILTYVGFSILPLIAPAMAAVEMDIERRRDGQVIGLQPRQDPPSSYASGYQPASSRGPMRGGQYQRQGGSANGAAPLAGVTDSSQLT